MKRKINGSTIGFTFDGGLEPLTFDATKAAQSNRAYAEMHGWSARIGDGAALSRKQKDGTIITITEAMRRDEIQRLVSHYESGTSEWDMGRMVAQNPLILALATKMGVEYSEAAKRLGEAELDKLAALLA